MMKRITIFVSALAISGALLAKVVPNSLFSDHAVFQQGVSVPVWGTADTEKQVTVEFNGQCKQAVVVNGKWMAQLDAMPAGGPYQLKISGENVVEMQDLYVGEVWICSGQSNMERQLGPRNGQALIKDWEQERDNANYPLIREYRVGERSMDEASTDANSQWVVCSPQTVENFSCVGYFFARDLFKARKAPIGMIFTAIGGTPAEHWTSRAALESHPEFKAIVQAYDRSLMNFAKQLARYKRNGSQGKAPVNPAEKRHPFGHYEGMVAPLQPYAIKGVIWYQGESNQDRSKQYQTLFPYMINNWRQDWKQGDFPFLFVQVAPYNQMRPEIREAQLISLLHTQNTAMVVTTDCGDAKDIHPVNKQPVGYRLSLAARALAYQEPIIYSGPLYESMKVEGEKVILTFRDTGKGLVALNGDLKGFTVAGADKVFVPAKARIKGNTVIVSCKEVSCPVAVRYGFVNVPDVNLFNKEGLPASPFRTDVD